MNSLKMSLLAGFLSAAGLAHAEQQTDPALLEAVRASDACLRDEVNGRLPDDVVKISEQERSRIRMEAASACSSYDEKLAAFTQDVRNGSSSLKDMTTEMLATSLRIADNKITERLKANAEKPDS